MGLPRTFVSFSSTDIHYYRLMQAWKANKHINFNFTDCIKTISSDFENYTKFYFNNLFSNIKIQKKYLFISLIVALILILIAVKTQNKYLYPMKIVLLLFLQIGIAIGRKFLWSFLFKRRHA